MKYLNGYQIRRIWFASICASLTQDRKEGLLEEWYFAPASPPPSCRPAYSLVFTLEWVKSCCSFKQTLSSPHYAKKIIKKKYWGLAAFQTARCSAKQRGRDKQLLKEVGKEWSPAQRWMPRCSSHSCVDLGEVFLKRAGAQPEWIITCVASEYCWSH